VLKVILGKEVIYNDGLKIKENYCRMWCLLNDCRCCRKKSVKGESEFLGQRMNILQTCGELLEERMNIKNHVQDSMDLQIIRGLVLKSRHRLLLPLLVMH
jgi:hypothetical protein